MSIVVVGAGLAGLACATELVRRGHEVQVFEASASSGGRCRLAGERGERFAVGARWFEARTGLVDWITETGRGGALRPWDREVRTLGPDGLVPCEEPVPHFPGEPVPDAAPTTFEGGLGALAAELAASLTVRVGWPVDAVRADPLGATVCYVAPSGERTVRAEAVVLAVPAADAGRILEAPSPSERALCEAVRAVPAVVVQAVLESAPAGVPPGEVRVPSASGLDLAGWSLAGAASGRALLRLPLRADAAARLARASERELLDHALGQAERTPLGKLSPARARVDRFACGEVEVVEGALAAYHEASDRSPSIALAGDWLGGGGVAGAMESGLAAADRVAFLG